MKICMKNDGSALIMVLMVMTMLTVVAIAIWRSADLIADAALQRLTYEQQFRVTEAVLNYGIALCKKNYSAMTSQAALSQEIILDATPLLDDAVLRNQYHGTITIARIVSQLAVCARLCKGQEKEAFCTLSCTVGEQKLDGNKVFMISTWSSREPQR